MFRVFKHSIMVAISLSLFIPNVVQAHSDQMAFVYKITHSECGQYWGEGLSDNSNIFLLKENFPCEQVPNIGDNIVVYFESDNLVDGIVKAEILK